MARYAYVAVVQTVDPAEPQRWEVTGDAVGVESEEEAVHCMIHGKHGLAEEKGVPAEHMQMVVWSVFETLDT